MARLHRFSDKTFGATIEYLMADKRVTYRSLAQKTGLSAGYLNHLVHGNRPVPSNNIVESIAKAFEVDPEYFREHRIRIITDHLEEAPDLVNRLYRRLGT